MNIPRWPGREHKIAKYSFRIFWGRVLFGFGLSSGLALGLILSPLLHTETSPVAAAPKASPIPVIEVSSLSFERCGPQPLTVENRELMPLMPLRRGAPVLVEWGDHWWRAEVLENLSDGAVKIHYSGWEGGWDEVVPRTRLRSSVRAPNPYGC